MNLLALIEDAMPLPVVCLAPKINECLLLEMDCSSLSKVQGYIIIHINSNITHSAYKVKKNRLQSHLLAQAKQLTAFLMLIVTWSK